MVRNMRGVIEQYKGQFVSIFNPSSRCMQAGSLAMGCVGFIASCGLAPAAALAQDNGGEPTRLQGVTVTDSAVEDGYKAEAISSPKATAPLIDTPRTVNVITGAVLEATASYSLQDALRTIPGITLGAGEGGTASADIPMIRGVDATSDTYVDGARDIGSQTRETFAVERIEVFKGPNSAFGGRGAAAGSINIVSKLPQDTDFATAQITGGTSDFKRASVDVNRKVGDKLAFRINAMWQDADVAGRDEVFDNRWGVAPSVTWGVGTDTQMTLSYYHYETDAMPDYGIPLTTSGQLAGGVRKPADTDYDNFYGLLDRDFQKTNINSVTALFSHDFGGGWLLSNTARWSHSSNRYVVTNPDDSKGNVVNGYVWRGNKSRHSNNEALVDTLNLAGQFETGGIQHSIAIGAEFSTAKTINRGYTVTDAVSGNSCDAALLAANICTTLANPNPHDEYLGTVALSTGVPTRTDATDYGFYAFDTITIIPQLLLNGGIRWNHYSVDATGLARGATIPYSIGNKSGVFSYQGGIVFKPIENASLYVSYADAYTPSGTDVGEGASGISTTNEGYRPQRTRNWEVGAKADLLGGALGLTAALFEMKRDNIVQEDANGDTSPIANKARYRGFELGANGKIGPVSLFAGYSYVDSELQDGSVNDGNVMPQAPKHNLTATASVQVTEAFSIGGGAYHASKRYADAANLNSADGYWRFDANASYRINDHFDVRVNIQNIGDERYVIKLRNPHFAVPAAGRQALLTLTARY